MKCACGAMIIKIEHGDEFGVRTVLCVGGHRTYQYLGPGDAWETAEERMKREQSCIRCGKKFMTFLDFDPRELCDVCHGQMIRDASEKGNEKKKWYRRAWRGKSKSPWFIGAR